MEYNKLVSVTGMSGLYELVSSKTDGGLVRSLEDNSTKFVSNRVHNFSHLESIEIYTVNDNVNLVDIFLAMQASDEAKPDAKADTNTIKSYFEKVYPELDFERVYVSDMKKMLKWFDVITKSNIEIKKTEHTAEEAEGSEDSHADKKPQTTKPQSSSKAGAMKTAPPKKINTPRKMA